MDAEARLDLTLAASAGGVVSGQGALEAFLAERAVPPRTRLQAALLLEEAVMNVAMHGHDDARTGEHRVELTLSLRPEALEMVIEDDGRAFDPVAADLPARAARLEDVRPGGLGVQLMRRFARELSYQRREGRNRLTLVLGRE